jgi:hypothetical protein
LIRKTLKGAVNDGGDGDEMKTASGEFGDPLTSKRMVSPQCGDKSQHIRLRWVQSKEQKLNKPHRREILCRDRFSMQITSEDTDDTDKLR